jgi:hypothetical protein
MILDCPLSRHTGEGRYPAIKILREADKVTMLSHLRGELLTIWIPAFAGMTGFFIDRQSGVNASNGRRQT